MKILFENSNSKRFIIAVALFSMVSCGYVAIKALLLQKNSTTVASDSREGVAVDSTKNLTGNNTAAQVVDTSNNMSNGTTHGNQDSANIVLQTPVIKVSGGTFQMGSDSLGQDAKPIHTVHLNTFYIGRNLVTQSLWQSVMNGTTQNQNDLSSPVTHVSWEDVQVFITRLNKLTKKQYRLPTEAEWEYAARGGNQSAGYSFSGTNDINEVHQHGRYNELGIYDMTGVLWQWCSDCYDVNYYNYSPADEPKGVRHPDADNNHVLRGGGYANRPENCTVTFRHYLNRADNDIGFRLALDTI